MKRLIGKSVLLAAIVVALSAGLLAVDTAPDVDVVGPKLEYFQEHAGDYDTVFVGSSYFYREIAPSEFDRVTAEAGVPTRSFNLGVPGMDPPETYYVVDRILAVRPQRLKYVVLELDYFREKVRPRNVHTRRFDYWHDGVRTSEAVRGARQSNVNWRKRAKDAGSHLEAALRRFFNIGRGRAYVEEATRRFLGGGDQAAVLGARLDGFLALDDEVSERNDVRRGFYSAFEEDRYAEKLDELKRAEVVDDENDSGVDPIDVEALRRAVARIEAAGARAVFVIPPCLATRSDLVRLADRGVVPALLVFNDPRQYPALYAPENRFDVGHLNKAGALLFTRELAAAFVDATQNRSR